MGAMRRSRDGEGVRQAGPGDDHDPPPAAEPGGESRRGARSGPGGLRGLSGMLGPWGEYLLIAAVCLLAVVVVNAFVAQPYVVPSRSMENTLRVGDRLVVDKLAYRFGGHVRRGDIVVFDGHGSFLDDDPKPSAGDTARELAAYLGLVPFPDSDYVKRVIGVGGDRVRCCDKHARITVNGTPLDESRYLFPGDAPSTVPFDVEVPAGRLWVMGDHRSASRDSRDHLGDPGGGFVPESQVIGRADWIVFPFDDWRRL